MNLPALIGAFLMEEVDARRTRLVPVLGTRHDDEVVSFLLPAKRSRETAIDWHVPTHSVASAPRDLRDLKFSDVVGTTIYCANRDCWKARGMGPGRGPAKVARLLVLDLDPPEWIVIRQMAFAGAESSTHLTRRLRGDGGLRLDGIPLEIQCQDCGNRGTVTPI